MVEGWLYDWENELVLERQNLDIEFYLTLLAQRFSPYSPVLELGCGTGRITLPLARAGYRVTGVDLSGDRLDVLRAKPRSEVVELVREDMCIYASPGAFDVALVPYSSFLLLGTSRQRIACLRCIERSLRPGGAAVVDISPNFLVHRDKAEQLTLEGVCRPLDAQVQYFESIQQDYVRQITRFRKRYLLRPLGASSLACVLQELCFEEDWHTVKVDEMRWLCQQAGLRIAQIYGTYGFEPLLEGDAYKSSSYKHIYLLEREAA